MIELEPGEEVLVRTSLHPLVRFPNLGFSACVLGVAALVVTRNELAASTIGMIGASAALIAVGASLVPHLRRRGFELAVTTQRLLVRTADGRLHAFDRQRMREVAIDQSWWGRLMGYASIVVPAEGGREVFAGVARPDAVRAALARRPAAGRRR